jgi:organic hydroperoxide reductase OsmC/OhrA
VRGYFRNTEKYDVDDAAPYFEEVTISVSVTSPAPASQVQQLIDHAERACHAAQTLRHGVPVSLEATLNGQPLSQALEP